MPKIQELSPHIANLIAAGEVVERPASAVKELLENAVDAGATKVTVEIRDGGMTFLRVTDNGCGMTAEDARIAFKRHATSKLRTEEDLAAISTMGFRGEALAAIASVSRIDLLTKTAEDVFGTSLHLEAGVITEEEEAGCPEGTTILIRDLFFNTPARMKFMKSDVVEGSRILAAVQMQALAHPEVAISLIRDGKQVLSSSGKEGLNGAIYAVYGREFSGMVPVDSRWEDYHLTGFVSKPTQPRASRNMQTFFVNGRPVKSRLLISALEEAYRNQIMVGKFPACVLHLELPASAVDVNVHPAKTEVKFLGERQVFECVHYGVLGALNKTSDRPDLKWTAKPAPQQAVQQPTPQKEAVKGKQESFFRTMTAEEYKQFTGAAMNPPKPNPVSAAKTAERIEHVVREQRTMMDYKKPEPVKAPEVPAAAVQPGIEEPLPPLPQEKIVLPVNPRTQDQPIPAVQEELPLPKAEPYRIVGELYRCYILVEQGDNAFLIDKHAAHERILFDRLKAHQEKISGQLLLSPISCRFGGDAMGELLSNTALLEELGFEIDEFGDNTLLIRQIPMDLNREDAVSTLEEIAANLLAGGQNRKDTVRDEILHTVACKAAIKGGWVTDPKEIEVLVKQVMEREDLKYCPHGRPICITLSLRQLEKQFKRG